MHYMVHGVGMCAGALLTFAAAAGAQAPDQRRVHEVRGQLSTPNRLDFESGLLQRLSVPEGFTVSVFAEGLGNPRMLAVAGNGTVFVARRDSNDVVALHDTDGDGRADHRRTAIAGIEDAHGVHVHGNRLYVVTITELYATDLAADGTLGRLHRLLDDIPDGGQHPNRTLAVGPDSMLYLSVGSTCNACDEPNPEHATLLRMRLDGSERTVYAAGLRNTIGFGWHPRTQQLWGLDHGTDWRGNDVPPEEVNRIEGDRHYGWPFCYGAQVPDSGLPANPEGMTKEEFCPTTAPPVLTFQAHSAPMQMVFYTGTQFPAEFHNDAFVAMRGSWNREPPVGYNVSRVRFDAEGRAMAVEPFVTGWLTDGGHSYFGRPTGMAMARDGSLLVSDDANGVIYRIARTGR